MRLSMSFPQYRRCECVFSSRTVTLAPLECEILSTLLLRRGEVVGYDELIEAQYPHPDFEPDNARKLLTIRLASLRRKLPGTIAVVWGRGVIIGRPSVERLAA